IPSMEIDDKSRNCLICSTPNSSVHFGIDACRACTAFFKRATLSGKVYPCRQGQRRCVVNREDPFMCRRCRFDKCLAIGMVYEGPMRSVKKPTEIRPFEPEIQVGEAGTSSGASEGLLERIAREYRKSFDRRMERENTLLSKNGRLIRVPHPNQKLYMTTIGTAVSHMEILVREAWQFYESVFPSLAELPTLEKLNLYRSYIPKFGMAECYYHTMRLWGGMRKYLNCSLRTCIDVDCLENMLNSEENEDQKWPRMIESMRLYVSDLLSVVAPSVEQARIDETEFHALLALIVCDSDYSAELSEAVLVKLDAIRDQVLGELQEYYRLKLELIDFSNRLGNLMTLCHTIRARVLSSINFSDHIFDPTIFKSHRWRGGICSK
ncbi:hypothetical protein PFISCL1PPCAC_12741, partial [Pristionchus fissidentatus]